MLFSSQLNIDGLVQDCVISSALAMGMLQTCTKPSIHPEFDQLTEQDKFIFLMTTVDQQTLA